MNWKLERKAVVGAVAALGLLGGGAAIAATQPWSPQGERDAVLEVAAEELGVEPEEREGALEKALAERIDAAVAEGRLTEEQGARLKERIQSGDFPLFGGRPGGHFGHELGGHHIGLETAASYLGLSEDELRAELESGETLADVAEANGKTVDGLVQALLDEATKWLDEAVANGRLTEEQKASLLERLEQRIEDMVNGELMRPGPGHAPRAGGFAVPTT